MRDLLFRGKRKDNGEWVEGRTTITTINLKNNSLEFFIPPSGSSVFDVARGLNKLLAISGYMWLVEPSTVGQYTGLTDKDDKKIFEGDVVAVPKSCFVKSPPYLSNGTIKGVIEFGRYKQSCCDKEETNLGYYIKWFSDNEAVRNMLRKDIMFWFSEHFNEIKVIGNKYDNPELLEVT